MTIEYKKGSVLSYEKLTDVVVVPHIVDCTGHWPSQINTALGQEYPDVEAYYTKNAKWNRKEIRPGNTLWNWPSPSHNPSHLGVASMACRKGPHIDYDAMKKCMDDIGEAVAFHVNAGYDISIAIPRERGVDKNVFHQLIKEIWKDFLVVVYVDETEETPTRKYVLNK